jgi:alpha-mannosidase
LRGELRARYALEVPQLSARNGRSPKLVRQPIDVALILDAASPLLRLRIRGVNRARDHRLRVVLATGIAGTTTLADAMFGPIAREPSEQPPGTETLERAAPTAPLARWVARFGTSHGVAVISDGLGEYEAMGDGSVAVTLVRAVGELSRNNLPERPGHAGWPTPTPAAQCIGPCRAEFGVIPHGSSRDEAIDSIERAADDLLLPLRGTTLRSALEVPDVVAGLTLEGAGLRFLACKPSADGQWTVLRCVNSTSRDATGTWRCGWPVREARRSRLDEQPGEVVPVHNGGVAITAKPGEAVTVLLR